MIRRLLDHAAAACARVDDALADDEAIYDCESCGDTFETNEGCLHDGHAWCGSCFVERCAECRDDLRDSLREVRD